MSYVFLDEAIHAVCSKGAIKVAVSAASFPSVILKPSIYKTRLLVGFLLSDKIKISCQIAFLAALVM